MQRERWRRVCSRWARVATLLIASGIVHAADPNIYRARLSPLGVTGATVTTITGAGSVTATLHGTQLSIQGKFEGLNGAATAANVRRGPKGIPGPVVFEIEFTKAPQGTLSSVATLTPAQIEDLRAGRLYVQVHSEKAPEGSIRGWLLNN